MRYPLSKFVGFILVLSLLLVSNIISIQPVNSQLRGAIYIRADGSIEGTSNIQRNGDLFTFTDDINGGLVVERDYIVIDGTGYTIQGINSRGIVLSERKNVTLKNTQITLDIGICIDLENATNCLIKNNTIFGLPASSSTISPSWWAGPIAIDFLYSNFNTLEGNFISKCYTAFQITRSNNNVVANNDVADCRLGIEFQDADGNILKNNRLIKSSFSVRADSEYKFGNNVDASNVIDGLPIIYWTNEKNRIVPAGAAFVALINCIGITAQGQSPVGMILVSTTNSSLINVRIADTWGSGIALVRCSTINIVRRSVSDRGIGISLAASSNNVICDCTIENCNTQGIALVNSNNNLITKNNLINNGNGIGPSMDATSGNVISENNFTGNEYALRSNGGTAIITGNTFTGNKQAIYWTSGSCNLTGNAFRGNEQAIYISGSNNFFRNNRMENDTKSLVIGDLITSYYGYSSTLNIPSNNIDSSNTIDGRPIIYWINQYDKAVPTDASTVILVSCINITAQNLYLTGNGQGIVLIDTKDSAIKNNTIIANDLGVGIFRANQNTFINNYIAKNAVGMRVDNSINNIITNNSFVENKGTYNGFAIIFTGSQKDNTIIRNDFIDNRVEPMLQISINKFDGPGWGNTWNDSTTGNYWSDYQTRYTNATEVNNSGTGNTPFVINENNIDLHPLLQPVNAATPAPSPSTSASPTIPPIETTSPIPTISPSETVVPSQLISSQPTAMLEVFMHPETLIAVLVVVFCIVAVGANAFLLRRRRVKSS